MAAGINALLRTHPELIGVVIGVIAILVAITFAVNKSRVNIHGNPADFDDTFKDVIAVVFGLFILVVIGGIGISVLFGGK